MVISWRSVTHMCFLAFSHQYQNKIFFPKPPNTFLTCFCWGGRRKYAGKKVRFNRGSNSQPPGYESDTLTTVPSAQDTNLCGFGQLGVKLLEMSYLMQVTCSNGCVCGQAEIANVSEVRLTLHVASGNNYFCCIRPRLHRSVWYTKLPVNDGFTTVCQPAFSYTVQSNSM